MKRIAAIAIAIGLLTGGTAHAAECRPERVSEMTMAVLVQKVMVSVKSDYISLLSMSDTSADDMKMKIGSLTQHVVNAVVGATERRGDLWVRAAANKMEDDLLIAMRNAKLALKATAGKPADPMIIFELADIVEKSIQRVIIFALASCND